MMLKMLQMHSLPTILRAPEEGTGAETTQGTGTETKTEEAVEAKTEQEKADTLFTKQGEAKGEADEDKDGKKAESSEAKVEEKAVDKDEKKVAEGDDSPLTMDNFKLPEGFEVNDKQAETFLGLLNDKEMSAAEKGQALLNLQTEALSAASDKISQDYIDTQTEWREAVEKDPTVGGDKLDGHLADAAKVLDAYADDEFRQLLASCGEICLTVLGSAVTKALPYDNHRQDKYNAE